MHWPEIWEHADPKMEFVWQNAKKIEKYSVFKKRCLYSLVHSRDHRCSFHPTFSGSCRKKGEKKKKKEKLWEILGKLRQIVQNFGNCGKNADIIFPHAQIDLEKMWSKYVEMGKYVAEILENP